MTMSTCTSTSTTTATSQEQQDSSPWIPYKGWRKRQCDFGSWDHACQVHTSTKLLDRLVSDCQTVFSARSTAHSSVHSTGSTYWFPLDAHPRCLLEQLTKAILEAHLPASASAGDETDGGASSQIIGAEWWTLCIDAEDAAVGFHWDLDYEAEERCNVYRTPYAGTVTYLCDVGAPTLVLEKAPTISSVDDRSPDNGKPIGKGWLSLPASGKHIRFPGACLHGAPDLDDTLEVVKQDSGQEIHSFSTLNGGGNKPLSSTNSKKAGKKQQKSKDGKRKKRVSLLVNVWLDGAPGQAAPLDHAIANKLSPCVSRVPFSLEHPTPMEPQVGDNKRQGFCWDVANCGHGAECQLFAQMPSKCCVTEGATVPLTFGSGEALLIS